MDLTEKYLWIATIITSMIWVIAKLLRQTNTVYILWIALILVTIILIHVLKKSKRVRMEKVDKNKGSAPKWWHWVLMILFTLLIILFDLYLSG